MSRRNETSQTLHQQKGAVSLNTFAEKSGISKARLLYYIRSGRLVGARKHPLTKRWWIYPPAQLVLGSRF